MRKEEIREQLAMDSCNISQAYLSDFDWKLKVRRRGKVLCIWIVHIEDLDVMNIVFSHRALLCSFFFSHG